MERHELLKLVGEMFGDGCQAFCLERHEQMHEHGFDESMDEWYSDNELVKAALFAINPDQFEWPFNWDKKFRDTILSKTKIDRFRVAGALLASEYDRLKHERL